MNEKTILNGFAYAKEVFSEVGIDVEQAISAADDVPVSMHTWQGDDLLGFDEAGALTGGIATTGNYPGRAATAEQLRKDISKAFELIPGKKRLNLHAIEAEKVNPKTDRDELSIRDFQNWVDFCREKKAGLDFNPTFFSHEKMDGDFSLASSDKGVRSFWIEHGKRCREIGNEISKQLNNKCVVNYWMPDGYKDLPADTLAPRQRMTESLNEIFSEEFNNPLLYESIESKLFGLGVESYTVANHEYSLCYALKNEKLYCLDMGHFHPTEVISAKISSVLPFLKGVLLHLSRGVRWDSDHVLLYDNELQNIMNEIIHNGLLEKTNIGLDFFDASINRIACWVIGMRNARKAILNAFLMPKDAIRKAEINGDYTSRLALMEESKNMPYSSVWDYYCLSHNIPVGADWLLDVKRYESNEFEGR